MSVGVTIILLFDVPLDGSNPNTNNNNVVITVIDINGIKTINHDTTVDPELHKIFKNNVNNIITINLINDVLYKPLYISIII